MRKIQYILLLLLWAGISIQAQQQAEQSLIWSRVKVDRNAVGQNAVAVPYKAAPQVPRIVKTGATEAIVGPNFRPNPTTNSTQSEMSIDMHPSNNQVIFGSANATNGPTVSTIYGTGVYYTTNGGTNWTNYDNPPFGTNSGDPVSLVARNGNFYCGFIDGGSNDGGQGVAMSTNSGATWTRYVVAPAPSGYSDLLDKNHMWVDKKAGSPYEGRVYAAWTDFISGNSNNQKIRLRYSTNGGQNWSADKMISANNGTSYLDQGVNINSGPNGEVYAVWAIYEDGSVSTGEDAIGFNVSTNGGETWGTPKKIYVKSNFGIRGNLTNKNSIRVSSFPSMAVNTNTGEIYVVFPQKGNITPCGNSIDICMVKSTDGGATWSTPVRVNNDELNNSKDQYCPWATVDQSTGGLYIVFYDSRNVTNDSAQVYMASSLNGGTSFDNIKISDASFKPKTISGLASGYQGDYIGIAAVNNNVYPYWCDDRTGLYQGWMCKVVVATYPLNAFNLNMPAAGTTLNSFPNSGVLNVFTWDTAASTATYKWVFGTITNPRMIQLPAGTNTLTITSGQLDDMLQTLGVAQGDSIVGQWNVWAYRNNMPQNDSMSAANGPRSIVLKRGVPQLLPFSLVQPVDNSRFVTSSNNSSIIQIKWRRSGEGIKYRWQFKVPNFQGQTKLNLVSDNNGYDSVLTISNNVLDALLTGIGLNTGDSLSGQWRVFGYRNPSDSLASVETWNITLKRQDLGEFVVVYDSTSAGCRTSKDSVLASLNVLGKTYDLFNRGGSSSTIKFSLKGYKKVIWLGEGTSTMTLAQKDSIKAFLAAGGNTTATKSKFICYSEDIGYNTDRSGATVYDSSFARSWLGIQYVADRPSSGGSQGIINLNTNQTDSVSGSGWPDILRKSANNPNPRSLYRFRAINSADSVNAVGKISDNYNVAIYGVDLESMRNATDGPGGSPVLRLLQNAISFVDEILAPPQPSVTVVAPNGGENWQATTSKNITWSSSNVANLKISYSTNNGTSWNTVVASVPASPALYSWVVPNTLSTQCLVKVSSALTDTVFDVSNAVFTISAAPVQITWESGVTVKDAGTTQQLLTFGTAPSATNGIDVNLGEISLPPAPPTGVFDARYELPVTPAESSVKDYRRDTVQSATWLMKFQPGTGGYPFTFTWNNATLPAGSFFLKDAVTGTIVNVDMKAQNSYSLTNTGITSLKIEYTKQTSMSWPMVAGWNMASVPLNAADMSTTTLYPTANSAIYAFNNGYQTVTSCINGKGYWVRFPAAVQQTISGSPVSVNTIPLVAGWNMIGVYQNSALVSALTTTPSGIINSVFYGFDNGYAQASTLVSGKGYWVRATQAGTINLPAVETVAKNGSDDQTFSAKEFGKLYLTDASGRTGILYTVNGQNSKLIGSNSDLPPVPPAGVFDIRFSGDKNAVVLGSEANTINISGASYPMTIKAEGMEIVLRDKATGGKLFNKVLKNSETAVIENSAINAVEMIELLRPAQYELMQNYPNPFNPSTTIKFGVPEKAHVTLTIYNQIGQKVTELANEEKEAGYYTYEWKANNFASGVYFYELRTDKFTSIKKLLLMK